MFSAKCAFGTYAICGTGCFEAYGQHPCLWGGGCKHPRVGYLQCEEELAGNTEEMNVQVPSLSPFSVFFCLGLSCYPVFCTHKYDGVNRAM